MAFHGPRGGSRGRGSGSGAFRGRGGSRGGGGRGGAPGRSRGRGSGGRGGRGRGRGKPIFDSARIAQKEADNEEESGAESSSEQEELDEAGSSEEEDDAPFPAVRPYELLLKSFTADKLPQAKRRKTEHVKEPESAASEAKDDVEIENVDDVEELEEQLDSALEGFSDEEEEEEEDASDPFESHFADPDDNVLARRLKAIQNGQWTTQRTTLPKIGRATIGLPQTDDTKSGAGPAPISGPGQLKLKQKLADVITKQRPVFDDLERSIAPIIFNYQDVLYCERTLVNQDTLRRLTCLHAVNHIFKTRDRVLKNNARLAKHEGNDELELRDQGFTRPKVLMILPTRESCVRMVNMITSLCGPEQEEDRKRFDDYYVKEEDDFATNKAEDFRDLFGGNDDDDFRLGLKFTRKTIKYFSQFYNSDIIFASPLGLRNAIQGAVDKKGHQKKGDYDYLSSIEIVIVDQADAIWMQNWENVKLIVEHLNLQPKEAHGCDFSRVRNWCLDTRAENFRQVIALAAFNTPELNALFFNRSKNWRGKARINNIYPGVIHNDILGVRSRQTFSRFETSSIVTEPDDRFEYFTKAIFPTLTRRAKDTVGTIIFIPSSLDFARVRNHFAKSSLSFASIDEYTDVKDIARARSHFLNGRHSVILYTERAHHFFRYNLRGVKRVIMYGLPENPIFYKEIVGGCLSRSVQEGKLGPGEGTVRVLFTKWDQMKLQRIAGTERAEKMIKDKGDTFDFV